MGARGPKGHVSSPGRSRIKSLRVYVILSQVRRDEINFNVPGAC